MLLAMTGFIMIALLMFFLLRGKATPLALFVVLPILAALINGFSITEIAEYSAAGVSTTWSMAALFVFVVTYFGIMTDTGMFDKLVQSLINVANGKIVGIFLAIVLIGTIGHLDGNSPTTYLIAIPALMPLCKKLNIRMQAVMLMCCSVITVMNLVPWGGVLNRQSIVLDMDSSVLWQSYLPIQIFGWICCIGMAFILAKVETKNGAGVVTCLPEADDASTLSDKMSEVDSLKRPKLVWFNVALTIFVFVLLFKSPFANYIIFMIGDVIALAVNYPNVKDQEERLKAHAPKVISLVATVLAAGVMVGILNNTGMITAMAEFIINALPAALNSKLHIIFGVFGGFMGLAVAPDTLYYGILPVLIEVCGTYGIPAQSVAIAFGVGADSCFTLAPVISSTFLGLAVSGLSLKEHMRFSFFPLWILGLLMILFGCLTGIIMV